MPRLSRIIRWTAVALGAILLAAIVLAVVVINTEGFRTWVRDYTVRNANRYLNGELDIATIGGTLVTGVVLNDVRVRMDGDEVIAVERLTVDYDVIDLIRQGLRFDLVRLERPVIHLVETPDGWNLDDLLVQREPGRPRQRPTLAFDELEIQDGIVLIDSTDDGRVDLPSRIERLDGMLAVDYGPDGFEVEVERLSLAASQPFLRLRQMSGTISSTPDEMRLADLVLRLDETDLHVDGSMKRGEPAAVDFHVTASPLALGEVARIVPAVGDRTLSPWVDARVTGTTRQLETSFHVRSAAGAVAGSVTAALADRRRQLAGEVDLDRFDVTPIVGRLPTDVTGHLQFDLTLPESGRPMNGRYRFSGPKATVAGYETSRVDVEGSLTGAELAVDGRAVAYGAAVTASGRVGLPLEGRPFTVDVRGRASDVDLRRLPARLSVPKLATDLDASSYRFQKTAGGFSVDAVLSPSIVEGAWFADRTTAHAASAGGGIVFAAAGHVTDVDVRRFGLRLDVDALQDGLYRSSLTGDFDVTGRYEEEVPLQLHVRADLTDSEFAGARVPQGAVTARLEQRRLSTDAGITFAGLDLAQIVDTSRAATSLSGRYDGTLVFEDVTDVRPEMIAASGRLTLDPSMVGSLDLASAVLDAGIADGLVTVEALSLTGPLLALDAKGSLALDREHDSDLAYRLNLMDLSVLDAVVDRELEGGLLADGRLTGNRALLRSEGTIDVTRLRVDGYEMLHGGGEVKISVPDLRVADASGSMTTTAAFVRVGDLQISSATLTASYAAQRLEFDTVLQEGPRELHGVGALVWHPDHQEVHLTDLTARTENLEWRLQSALPGAPGGLDLKYGGDRVEINDVTFVSSDQQITVSGSLPFSGERDATGEIRVSATRVDLSQLDELLGFEYGAAGRLSGQARVAGSLASPRVSADIDIVEGRFGSYAFERLAAAFEPAAGRLRVDARLEQGPDEWLTVNGSLPLALATAEEGDAPATGELDLMVETSTVGLGLVEAFTSRVTEVQGNLQAQVHVTGPTRDPTLTGTVSIHGGAFLVADSGVRYRNLETTVRLLDDRIEVAPFELVDGAGQTLRVGGELALEAGRIRSVDLVLSSSGVQVLNNNLGDVEVTSDVRLSGTLTQPLFTGRVEIVDAQIDINEVLALVETRRRRSRLPIRLVGPPDGPDERQDEGEPTGVALDLDVRVPDNLVVQGSSPLVGATGTRLPGALNVTLGGSVNVATVPGETVRIRGSAHTVRGTYEFQGRQFEVGRDGSIRFQGGPEIDPFLNIIATRTISGVEVRVNIAGSLREPVMTLSSNPPQDSADIMALIIFNQPLSQLGGAQRVSVAEQAGGLATGVFTGPLAASINRALGFDRFELGATSGLESAALTLGEQVGERLFVKFTQQVGAQEYSQFVLELRLSDRLRLQTSLTEGSNQSERSLTNRSEQAGADLVYVWSR